MRTLFTINEEEDDEIWPPEVEAALREALLLYPSGRRKIKKNGKIFGIIFLEISRDSHINHIFVFYPYILKILILPLSLLKVEIYH